jgi:hypothetical protein
MLGPAVLFTPLALICANASSQFLVYRVSKQGRTSLDHPACKESSTGNTATSDTRFNFPEAFGIALNLGYVSIYSLHESLRCSPIETNGFEIFVSGVLIEA